MGAAIKYMIENNWEANPTINPGDMFTTNDCAIGNVHPATSPPSCRSSGPAS
jgi:acetone carboxylase alpha subunit